jgi:aminopeptidase N
MMKKILVLFVFLVVSRGQAQEHVCAKGKRHSMAAHFNAQAKMAAASAQISHELKYDVTFVHLDVKLERTSKYISGGVRTVAKVASPFLDTFMTLLHVNHTIDSMRFNGILVTPLRQDSMVKFSVPNAPLTNGTSFTVMTYYKGTPPSGGSAIGSGMTSAASWYGGGNRATWSLSESFVAYHWWPCKQILTDKIDSSWVYITTDSTNKAGSNGLLKNVVVVGNKKRYEWKSKKPIAYYLISVAVSRFKEYNFYAKPQYLPNDSILIQNYIDASAYTNPGWISSDLVELNKMPQTMNFLCNAYGMYPFYKEKYGHCMVALGGGMEHNTMTTIGYFDFYIDAHELGHQWWGDNVTCKSWGDIWLNEGFASYTEHLVAEYLDPTNFATNLNSVHNNVMSQPGGSIFFTGSDTLNSGRIFSSRLTYDKGGAIIHSLRFLTNNDSVWFNTLRGFQNTYKNSTASALDFQNYYQASTGINPTQFFSQWYYGQGYPTFNVKYNYTGTQFILKSSQTVSAASVTPVFITPLEYKISRTAKPDTFIRVMHTNPVEIYTLNITGTVTGVFCDPKNWILNLVVGPARDFTLGVAPTPTDVTSIDEAELFNEVKIGPNPTKGNLLISNPLNASGSAKIFDLSGKLLAEKVLVKETIFDLASFSSGIYLVKITDAKGEEKYSQKVIRE